MTTYSVWLATFPIVPWCCSWLCVWVGCNIIFCQILIYVYIPRNLGFVSIITMQSTMRANCRIHWGLKVVFVCYHITLSPISLSSLCMQIYLMAFNIQNACQVYSVERVPKIVLILSIIFIQHMWLCVFSFSIPLVMIMRIYVLYLITIMKWKYEPLAIV